MGSVHSRHRFDFISLDVVRHKLLLFGLSLVVDLVPGIRMPHILDRLVVVAGPEERSGAVGNHLFEHVEGSMASLLQSYHVVLDPDQTGIVPIWVVSYVSSCKYIPVRCLKEWVRDESPILMLFNICWYISRARCYSRSNQYQVCFYFFSSLKHHRNRFSRFILLDLCHHRLRMQRDSILSVLFLHDLAHLRPKHPLQRVMLAIDQMYRLRILVFHLEGSGALGTNEAATDNSDGFGGRGLRFYFALVVCVAKSVHVLGVNALQRRNSSLPTSRQT
mmetsp:Transcript_6974/g.5225  ORF Transcript_6974/g.5225 Transcript_6974/m.5225 type:complete len:276 (-) Transcript_6974:711-1538(-)